MDLPERHLAIARATVIALLTWLLLSNTIGQASPAISHARKPALQLSNIMTWFRSG
jgi:hypothetical protein